MEGMVPTERGREMVRLWAARRGAIVAALPNRLPDSRPVSSWLSSAWSDIHAPHLDTASPAALVAAVETAAADGLLMAEGRILALPDGSAAWIVRPRVLATMIMRADPEVHVRADTVCAGDHWKLDRNARGRVTFLGHHRSDGRDHTAWERVWAVASVAFGPRAGERRHIVLDRAEAERLAAVHLCLPVPEPAEDAALRVALILLWQGMTIERGWEPARRLDRVVQRIWTETAEAEAA